MPSLFQKYPVFYAFQMETFPLGNSAKMKIGNYVGHPTYALPFPHLSPFHLKNNYNDIGS